MREEDRHENGQGKRAERKEEDEEEEEEEDEENRRECGRVATLVVFQKRNFD